MVVGWLKPVVIVPAAALSGLTARPAGGALRARARARPTTRLSRQPAPVRRRDPALLPPGRVVDVRARARGARALLRRPRGVGVRPRCVCGRADDPGGDGRAPAARARRDRRIARPARPASARRAGRWISRPAGWPAMVVAAALVAVLMPSGLALSREPAADEQAVAAPVRPATTAREGCRSRRQPPSWRNPQRCLRPRRPVQTRSRPRPARQVQDATALLESVRDRLVAVERELRRVQQERQGLENNRIRDEIIEAPSEVEAVEIEPWRPTSRTAGSGRRANEQAAAHAAEIREHQAMLERERQESRPSFNSR